MPLVVYIFIVPGNEERRRSRICSRYDQRRIDNVSSDVIDTVCQLCRFNFAWGALELHLQKTKIH